MERWEIQYDKWKTDTPDNYLKTFCYCEVCGGEIYVGDEYLEVEGNNIHEDCFDEYAKIALNPIRKVAGEDEYCNY